MWNLVGFLTSQEHSLGWLGGALAKGSLLLFIGIIGSVWNLVGFLKSQEHSRESYIIFIYKSIFKNTQRDSPIFSSLSQMCRGVWTSLGPSRSFQTLLAKEVSICLYILPLSLDKVLRVSFVPMERSFPYESVSKKMRV